MKTLIFFLLASTKLWASSCDDVETKIIFDKKEIYKSEVLCLKKTSDNMVFYVSKSCAEDQCEVLKRKKKEILIKDYHHNVGSPGFKLCEELGGVPQIFEFAKDKKIGHWQSSERCFFGKDFIEISLLTREWKSFIKKN